MQKYIVLFGGVFLLGLSFVFLYFSYTPRVGPIGNGPNDKLIWFNFTVQFITGSLFILQAVLLFREKN